MAPTPPQPSAPPGNLFRRTLRRRWRPILATWIVGSAALATAAYFAVRPEYRAASYLRVDPSAAQIFEQRNNGEKVELYLQTQVHLITSPNVLTSAGRDPKVVVLPRIQRSGDVVIELRKAITVNVIPGTFLFEVASVSPSAHEAATLVNAVVGAFLEASVEWSDGMTRSQIKNLEIYLDDLRNQSDELERRWKELVVRGQNNAQVFVKEKQADGPGGALPEQARWLHQMLFEANIELALAEAWASSLKTAAMTAEKNPGSKADEARVNQKVERRFRQDPEVIELAAKLNEANDKLQRIKQAAATPDDPAVRQAAKNFGDLQVRYSGVFEARTPALREEVLAEMGSERELREAEARVRSLRVRAAALKAQFDKLEVAGPRNAVEVEIALVRDRRESLKSMQDTVIRRLEQLKFESKDGPRIRVVDVAVPPGRPIRDYRLRMLAAAPLVMLPLAFALFLGVEGLSGPPVRAAKEEPPAEV